MEYNKDRFDIRPVSLQEKKVADPAFSNNAAAQLEFVYKHSPYYEPVHLRYPVYRMNE